MLCNVLKQATGQSQLILVGVSEQGQIPSGRLPPKTFVPRTRLLHAPKSQQSEKMPAQLVVIKGPYQRAGSQNALRTLGDNKEKLKAACKQPQKASIQMH